MRRWAGWLAELAGELIEALREPQNYEVELAGRVFQVEVQMLENTERYVHVALAVDDGICAATVPASDSSICAKPPRET